VKLAIKSTLLLALLSGPAFAEEKKDETPKKVKFTTLKTQHMVVEAKVNGKGPYRLIFDTGAPLMLVNNRLAKDAGVIDRDSKPGFALFGMAGAPMKMKTFELGELKLENVSTMVMDHPTVTAISQMFGPIDGIVGFPFFAQFRTTVDYQKKELTFVPTGYKPGDIFQDLQAKLMSSMGGNAGPTIVAPAAQWGFSADKDAKDDDAGVVVKDVLAGSPAAKAGLMAGDRLLTLDGRWTDSVIDLFEAASHVKPGQTVPLKLKRGDKPVELKVTPTTGL
jgi:hypothetical protein